MDHYHNITKLNMARRLNFSHYVLNSYQQCHVFIPQRELEVGNRSREFVGTYTSVPNQSNE